MANFAKLAQIFALKEKNNIKMGNFVEIFFKFQMLELWPLLKKNLLKFFFKANFWKGGSPPPTNKHKRTPTESPPSGGTLPHNRQSQIKSPLLPTSPIYSFLNASRIQNTQQVIGPFPPPILRKIRMGPQRMLARSTLNLFLRQERHGMV